MKVNRNCKEESHKRKFKKPNQTYHEKEKKNMANIKEIDYLTTAICLFFNGIAVLELIRLNKRQDNRKRRE